MATPAAAPPRFLGRIGRYLSARPVLCLALLTPGIPEYLSGSSSPIGLIQFPPLFGLFLLANLGLYTAGVLLIREAKVRWDLGWAAVLVLGVAYGLAEEGLALDTLFNLHAGPVTPATAGHLLGVNWIWSSEILVFHALFSVALPIFLLEIALPAWRARPILSARGLRVTAGLYVATIAILGVAIGLTTYWMGLPVLVGSLLALAGLVALARALPKDAVSARPGPPTASPTRLALLGVSVLPALIIVPGILPYFGLPLEVLCAVAPALAVLVLALFLERVGTIGSRPGAIAFAAGLIAPVAAFGVFFALRLPAGLPLVLAVDALAVAFLRFLYRRSLWEERLRLAGPPALPVGSGNPPTPRLPMEGGAGRPA